jgi:hypothetical protein
VKGSRFQVGPSQLNHVRVTRFIHELIATRSLEINAPSTLPLTIFDLPSLLLPPSRTMPKRKTTSIHASPTQPSLSRFLPSRKQALHPTAKRTKIEEAGSPPKPINEVTCESIVHSSTKDDFELVTILELIDEVILFAGKPMLWSHIQEEIYSLHRRYFNEKQGADLDRLSCHS